jgi:uncharacterized protein
MSQARPHNVGTFVDASLLAARGGELRQQFLLSDLPRVSEHATDLNASAALSARFSKVDQHVVVDGIVAATLRLSCQRCMQSVEIDVEDEFNVVILPSEAELDKLAESQDAIVSDPSRLDLAWLTEDQLLLAIPLVPLHATPEHCGLVGPAKDLLNEAAPQLTDEDGASDTKSTTQFPFAALRDMLKKV